MPVATRPADRKQYKRDTATRAERSRAISQSGRDIGSIPAIADMATRAKVRRSFRAFCEICLPNRFGLAWSSNHLRAIQMLEQTVLGTGLLAYAMPRGEGKTTLAEAAALWATLEAYHRFVVVIGATQPKAEEILASWKVELAMNDRLAELYPAACYPIRALEGEPRRAMGQLHHGRRTFIEWGVDTIGLAQIPGEPASGARMVAMPMTGAIRGMKRTMPDGAVLRPTFVICDDPQTKESANSPTQTQTRLELIKSDIMGLAGPDSGISVMVPCTVIKADDLSDQLLDRKRHPEWRGVRTKMVEAWPTEEQLWDRYQRIREESLEQHGDIRDATAFYEANRKAMDKGAKVSWEARRIAGCVSALQTAIELRLRNPEGFGAEYQNEPTSQAADATQLRAGRIIERLNGVERGVVPDGRTTLSAMIDVQGRALYYLVAAWSDGFTGDVVDFGTWPDQGSDYFTLAKLTRTLGRRYPGAGLEGSLTQGLRDLVAALAGRVWPTVSGEQMRIQRMLIDANWGQSTDVVYSVCESSEHAAILTPSHGKGITASMRPIGEYRKQRGDRFGLNWYQPKPSRRRTRAVIYDTNWWKSFIAARLTATPGDVGAVQLFGDRPDVHRMLADHLTAEVSTRTKGRGRELDEWKHRPAKPDNHLFDCITGAAVAASMAGVQLPGEATTKTRRKRVSLAEMQAKRASG